MVHELVFDRVEVDVIEINGEVAIVADCVFPVAAPPNAATSVCLTPTLATALTRPSATLSQGERGWEWQGGVSGLSCAQRSDVPALSAGGG